MRLFGYGVLVLLGMAGISTAAPLPLHGVLDVRTFGATGDGVTMDTAAVQAAIDACSQAGGGTVYVPPGNYLAGTIVLKSGVTLHLARGATLLGSTNLDDYPAHDAAYRSYTDNYTNRALIFAENQENIAICGEGVIDGQGAAFSGEYKKRPYMVRFVTCRNVRIEDVTLQHGAMWTVHFLACENVAARGAVIRSRCNKNNDGLDIDGCDNVRISDCDISSGDDAIVLKSTSARPCRNVAITNCVLSTACNAIKMGTESNGGFQNVAISNCTVYDTRLAGIALEIVDGGTMDGIAIANVAMQNVGGPIFVRLGNRVRPFQDGMERPGTGVLRNVSISDVVATGADVVGCSITGLPGHPVENVSLRNVRIVFAGGGTAEFAGRVPPEQEEKYPEYRMFEELPAYAFYCRHARGISLDGVSVAVQQPDARPALVCDDVQALTVTRFDADPQPEKADALLRFINVRDACVRGCAPDSVESFLRVEGEECGRIAVLGNDLARVSHTVTRAPGVAEGAAVLGDNVLAK